MPFDSINEPLSNVELWIKAIENHPNFNMQNYPDKQRMKEVPEMCAACIAREDVTLKARGLKLPERWEPRTWYRDIATPLAKFMGLSVDAIHWITYEEILNRDRSVDPDIDTNKEYVIKRIRDVAKLPVR